MRPGSQAQGEGHGRNSSTASRADRAAGRRRRPKKRLGLVVAVVVAVVAIGAFGYAIVWSGGVDQVKALRALPRALITRRPLRRSRDQAPAHRTTGKPPVNSSQLAAVALPAWATTTMYEEQLTSQVGITSMVDDKVNSFAFAKPATADNGVQVPLKATFRDGATHSGTISLIQIDGNWFFAGLDTGVSKEVPATTRSRQVSRRADRQGTGDAGVPRGAQGIRRRNDHRHGRHVRRPGDQYGRASTLCCTAARTRADGQVRLREEGRRPRRLLVRHRLRLAVAHVASDSSSKESLRPALQRRSYLVSWQVQQDMQQRTQQGRLHHRGRTAWSCATTST